MGELIITTDTGQTPSADFAAGVAAATAATAASTAQEAAATAENAEHTADAAIRSAGVAADAAYDAKTDISRLESMINQLREDLLDTVDGPPAETAPESAVEPPNTPPVVNSTTEAGTAGSGETDGGRRTRTPRPRKTGGQKWWWGDSR
jgi:hypothetical protein